MRILIVSHLFPSKMQPNNGRFIYNHVKALSESGLTIKVLQPVPWAPRFLGSRTRWQHYRSIRCENDFDRIEVTRLPYPHPPAGRLNGLGSIMLIPALARALMAHKDSCGFDLVHAHCVTPDGFASVVVGKMLKKPVVVSARGSDVHCYPHRGRIDLATARYSIERCDRFVCVSEALAREVRTLTTKQQRATVIHNGVDAELFSPCLDRTRIRRGLGLPPTATIILCVGALIREKGILELIGAFESMSDDQPDLILVVVGDGPLRGELEKLGERLGGKDRVILPGVVPNETVADYMRASDVFVHPSHAEGLPNVVLEAMASGLPVIASRVGGIPEVVVEGVTGILIDPKDATDLGTALQTVLIDVDRAREMGVSGRARMLARHRWERNALEHLELYRMLISCQCRDHSIGDG